MGLSSEPRIATTKESIDRKSGTCLPKRPQRRSCRPLEYRQKLLWYNMLPEIRGEVQKRDARNGGHDFEGNRNGTELPLLLRTPLAMGSTVQEEALALGT